VCTKKPGPTVPVKYVWTWQITVIKRWDEQPLALVIAAPIEWHLRFAHVTAARHGTALHLRAASRDAFRSDPVMVCIFFSPRLRRR
jgi:hypothetical protein